MASCYTAFMFRGIPRFRRRQGGYLYEYPVMLAASIMLVVVLVPMLPPLAGKLVVSVAAVPVLVSLHYMIVTPGWQPGARRLGPVWRWLGFSCAVIVVLVFVVAIWMHQGPVKPVGK